MPRRHRRSKRRAAPAADWQSHYLRTGEPPPQDSDPVAWDEWLEWQFFNRSLPELAWGSMRTRLLTAFVKEQPGRRPWAWWCWDAPRFPVGTWPGSYCDGKLPLARDRVGGSGITPWDANLAQVPAFDFGLPCQWHEFEEADPPQFESQAAYLRRLGLLTPSELRRLSAADFDPELLALVDKTKTIEELENVQSRAKTILRPERRQLVKTVTRGRPADHRENDTEN